MMMMKKYLIAISILISGIGISQSQISDTAQIVVEGRTNSSETLQKPYVILISADGFRFDYIRKFKASNLDSIGREGVCARRGMYPTFPSATFPNHYSIITGMYPSHHGIVNNVFYDPTRDEKYIIGTKTNIDGSWYKGLPLWGLAESQGMLAASLFWVGSESNAGGFRPTYYYQYHEKFGDEDKIKIIKNWLTLPEAQRPHFITLYFPEVDKTGHQFGPDAAETEAAVHFVDNAIRKLTEALAPLNLPINFVFLSDHGMIAVEPHDYIPIPEIDREKYEVVNTTTMLTVTAKDPCDILSLYGELLHQNPKNYTVYLAENFPEELHYSTREDSTRRIGDIMLVPRWNKIFVKEGRSTSYGKHGFNPYKVPEMKAVFIAWGPAFNSEQIIYPFENIHVYPMIAEILGLEITTPVDGNSRVLEGILKKD